MISRAISRPTVQHRREARSLPALCNRVRYSSAVMASLECLAQRAPISTIIWALLRQMTPRPSCMDQASMSLQILIGTASPSLAVDLRVEGRTTATVYAIDRGPHHPARSRHGAEVKAKFRLCRSTSRKRALKRHQARLQQDRGSIGDTASPRPRPACHRTESIQDIEA